jgi:hypothetical protein
MVLHVSISSEAEAKLKVKAAAAGVDIETYAARQLEFMASVPFSLQQLSGPVYQKFLDSGTTDDQLAEELEQAKHERRAERRARRAS